MTDIVKQRFQSPQNQPIRVIFRIDEAFPGKTVDDINSAIFSFKDSPEQDDDAILLKNLTTGVVKDTVTENGVVKIRLSLGLSSNDWGNLTVDTNYILAIGIKFSDMNASDAHIEVLGSKGEPIQVAIEPDTLRAQDTL